MRLNGITVNSAERKVLSETELKEKITSNKKKRIKSKASILAMHTLFPLLAGTLYYFTGNIIGVAALLIMWGALVFSF